MIMWRHESSNGPESSIALAAARDSTEPSKRCEKLEITTDFVLEGIRDVTQRAQQTGQFAAALKGSPASELGGRVAEEAVIL